MSFLATINKPDVSISIHDIAHRGLVEQLMAKSVKRKYVALVHGNIPHDYGTVSISIRCTIPGRISPLIPDKFLI
jgi:23S rRNA-/tRNA-specific pseudouridylate synthase